MLPTGREVLAYRNNSLKTLIIFSCYIKNKIANDTTSRLWAFPSFCTKYFLKKDLAPVSNSYNLKTKRRVYTEGIHTWEKWGCCHKECISFVPGYID
jgi:hypothetical protein